MIAVGEMPDITPDQVANSRSEYKRASSATEWAKRLLDVYTSQWFGNEPTRTRSGEVNPVVEFLGDKASELWAENPTKARLTFAQKDLVKIAVDTSREQRFFHWELEFPEVFLGRLGTGFDAVIGNPPYDEPSAYYSDAPECLLSYLDKYPLYTPFKSGRTNLFRLFMLRTLSLVSGGHRFSFIVPMALLGDEFSRPLRTDLLSQHGLVRVEAFPQKDDPKRRVFPEAKLSTTIIVTEKAPNATDTLRVRVHPGRDLDETSPGYECRRAELLLLFPRHPKIPAVSEAEFRLIQKLGRQDWPCSSDVAAVYVGEVFDNAPNKKYLSDHPIGPVVTRGANIDRYVYRTEASQGAPRYIDLDRFLRDKDRSAKVARLNLPKVGVQRGAAVDMWRRLLGCVVPPGQLCFDTVLLLLPLRIDIRLLLALVNSDVWGWLFQCMSATNHVNEYDLADFRIPVHLTDPADEQAHRLMSLADQCLRSSDVRRTDAQLISAASPDRSLDAEIFDAYGIGPDERAVIADRVCDSPRRAS